MYEAIIHNRLVCYLEKELLLSPAQGGYRPKKSTADHIFVLQELFLECRFNKIGKRGGRNKKALYVCFLDLVKAFDKVLRDSKIIPNWHQGKDAESDSRYVYWEYGYGPGGQLPDP